jgi:hypothetical protein
VEALLFLLILPPARVRVLMMRFNGRVRQFSKMIKARLRKTQLNFVKFMITIDN